MNEIPKILEPKEKVEWVGNYHEKLILLLMVLGVVLVGCGGETPTTGEEIAAEENLPGETETSEIDAPTAEPIIAASTQPSSPRTPAFSFAEDYCPLTPEIVKRYCQIKSPLVSEEREFHPCGIKLSNGMLAAGFSALPIPEEYGFYGVSNIRDYNKAEMEAFAASGVEEYCPIKIFTLDYLAEETIVSSAYDVNLQQPDSCPNSRVTNYNDLTSFRMYVKNGEEVVAFLEGGRLTSDQESDGCSVSEMETLVRSLLLGQEVQLPPEEIVPEVSAPLVEEIEEVEERCMTLSGICDKVNNKAKEKFGIDFSPIQQFYDICGLHAPTTQERINRITVEWRYRPGGRSSTEDCQISIPFDEYKVDLLGVMGGSELDGPQLEGLTNYFYATKVGFIYLYFQDQKNQGVYEVKLDARNIASDRPRDDQNEKLNIVAEFTTDILLPFMKKCKARFYKEQYQGTVCTD